MYKPDGILKSQAVNEELPLQRCLKLIREPVLTNIMVTAFLLLAFLESAKAEQLIDISACGTEWDNTTRVCRRGYCCSEFGYCGDTPGHCNPSNCQPEYGICGDASTPPAPDEGKCSGNSGSCKGQMCCSETGYCGSDETYCDLKLGCQSDFGFCWSDGGLSTGSIAGIAVGATVFVSLLVAPYIMYKKFRKSAKRFSYNDLYTATKGFSDELKLGDGMYGEVYKGHHDGRDIAVKKLKRMSLSSPTTASSPNVRAFEAEVETMSARLNHKNLVAVIGYCVKNNDRFLVYDFVPNRSLDKWLFASNRDQLQQQEDKVHFLEWPQRFTIARGIAEGLIYLHHSLSGGGLKKTLSIVHGDIKPDNILLDLDLTPKLGDFGMAKLIMTELNVDIDETNTDNLEDGIPVPLRGTPEYRAPEARLSKQEQYKTDVYSFGKVLLEILSGRRVISGTTIEDSKYLPVLAVQCIESEPEDLSIIVDPAMELRSKEKEQARRVLRVALWCLEEPTFRPNMMVALDLLKGNTIDYGDYQNLPPNFLKMKNLFRQEQKEYFGQQSKNPFQSGKSWSRSFHEGTESGPEMEIHSMHSQPPPALSASDHEGHQEASVELCEHSSNSLTHKRGVEETQRVTFEN